MSSKSTFEQSLRTAARNLPTESIPGTLSARVMNGLPAPAPKSVAARWVPRLVAASAVAGVAVAGVYLMPRAIISQSYAASMKQAIANAQTWHFTGWRLVNGERVRWEVWGRRTPFLYREQVGNEVLIDNGTKRFHVLAPDAANGRKTGTVLILPSERLHTSGTGSVDGKANAGYFLAGINGDRKVDCAKRTSADFACTSTQSFYGGPTETEEATTLQVDGQTHLPTLYKVTRREYAVPGDPGTANFQHDRRQLSREYTEAEIKPEYNVALTDSIAEFAPPKGYTVMDATTGANGSTNDPSLCTRKGVTLKASVVGRDGAGNMHLRIQGWLGSQPIVGETTKLWLQVAEDYDKRGVHFDVATRQPVVNHLITDDAGNKYVVINQPYNQSINGETPDVWIAPLEPIVPGSEAPTTLSLTLRGSLSRYERMGNSGRTIPVAEDSFTFQVPIPQKTAPLGWETAPNSHGMRFVGVKPTFRQEQAEKRGQYYVDLGAHEMTVRGSTGQREIAFSAERPGWFARAAYWHKIAEQEARNHSDKRAALQMRINVANDQEQGERAANHPVP